MLKCLSRCCRLWAHSDSIWWSCHNAALQFFPDHRISHHHRWDSSRLWNLTSSSSPKSAVAISGMGHPLHWDGTARLLLIALTHTVTQRFKFIIIIITIIIKNIHGCYSHYDSAFQPSPACFDKWADNGWMMNIDRYWCMAADCWIDG